MEELDISGGTAILVLTALYFIIMGAVKNGVKSACRDIMEGRNAGDGPEAGGVA